MQQTHRMIERDLGGKKHWLENVARFKPAEMAAGLKAISKALLHAYTIAYAFTSRDEANQACCNMGLVATKNNGVYTLTVSLRSPAGLHTSVYTYLHACRYTHVHAHACRPWLAKERRRSFQGKRFATHGHCTK